jgi:hypothetical protein
MVKLTNKFKNTLVLANKGSIIAQFETGYAYETATSQIYQILSTEYLISVFDGTSSNTS